MRSISPRRVWHRSITVPVYSLGRSRVTVRYGSSMNSIWDGDGISEGLSTSIGARRSGGPRYSTLGAVAMRDRSNSRSRRSRTISMCSSPRNPQRNPNPSAPDVSGS